MAKKFSQVSSCVLDDDAGQLLDMLSGQYQQRPNLDPWLKGFTGSTINSERKSGSACVAHTHLSMLLMLQPSAFDDLLQDKRASGRGFVARFLFCEPAAVDEIGDEPDIPDRVTHAYQAALRRLADMPETTLQLTEEARAYFLGV